MRYSFVLVLSAFLFVSCKPKTDVQTTTDSTTAVTPPPAQSIQSTPMPTLPKLAAGKHGDTTVTPSGLMIIDLKVGKGAMPKSGQTITVNYTGQLLDGKVFDSNVDPNFHHVEPFATAIGVGKVIPGWDEGMLTMKVGGKRRLIIPSELAYGPGGQGDIPPNSPLIFDVELLKVQ
jgi:FKBP-type peptidyl-prolyl cis-trans isomerase FkpA